MAAGGEFGDDPVGFFAGQMLANDEHVGVVVDPPDRPQFWWRLRASVAHYRIVAGMCHVGRGTTGCVVQFLCGFAPLRES